MSGSRERGTTVHVEGIEIPVAKDANLERFLTMLKEQVRQQRPQPVEATITGRFFAGVATKDRNGKTRYVGYGHLGQHSLLLIQQVAGVRLSVAPRKAK